MACLRFVFAVVVDDHHHPSVLKALPLLRRALSENQLLYQQAYAANSLADATFYDNRVRLLRSVLPNADGDAPPSANTDMECIAANLLVQKDRFDCHSSAFLGRGASALVSRGVLIDSVGSHETRTTVAVKEIAKAGVASEQEAMREFLMLTKQLGGHCNVIRILAMKSSSNAFLVVMDFCPFSLRQLLPPFRDFLHAPNSPVGALVLNALVQDICRGVAFLHTNGVFHCDIKPSNILVAFDRSGKPRKCKSKYFDQAQLKIADFGVSRVVRLTDDAQNAANTTVTISTASLEDFDGIAGTAAFMCPELLRIVRLVASRRLDQAPDISPEILAINDAFGCGCVIALLCGTKAGGRHPFDHGDQSAIPDNILAHRRVNLRARLGIRDDRHIQLVDMFTTSTANGDNTSRSRSNISRGRCTVIEALRRSTVFESTTTSRSNDGAEILRDTIQLYTRPAGSCKEQLLAHRIVNICPLMPEIIGNIERQVRHLMSNQSSLHTKLDEES